MSVRVKRMSLLFWLAVVAMCAGSFSLSFIPIAIDVNTLILGIAFWIFHIMAYVLLIFVGRARKGILSNRKRRTRVITGWGIISFFKTALGTLFDVLAAVLLALLVVLGRFEMDYEAWYYLIISSALLSLQLHGMFNGKNYRSLIQFKKERQHEKV